MYGCFDELVRTASAPPGLTFECIVLVSWGMCKTGGFVPDVGFECEGAEWATLFAELGARLVVARRFLFR